MNLSQVPIVGIIRLLRSLLSEKSSSRAKSFDDLVIPLHSRVVEAADDCIAILHDTRVALNDDSVSLGSIAAFADDRRLSHLSDRVAIRSEAKALADNCDDPLLARYGEQVAQFFFLARVPKETIGVIGAGFRSVTEELTDWIRLIADGTIGRSHAASVILEAEQRLEQSKAELIYAFKAAQVESR